MDTIAYLYLATPEPDQVPELFDQILSSGVSIDAFGLRDPPKKWQGDTTAMSRVVLSRQELNKWCFFNDRKHKLSASLVLRYEASWGFSTLSFSAPDRTLVCSLARELARTMNPFLAIQGISGGGKAQDWVVLHQRQDCPAEVRASVNAA